jgi:mono/diheme cytochrome c family protein
MKKFCMLLIALSSMGAVAAKTPPSTPELLAKGKAAYTANCLTCHGDKGDGNGPVGKMLNPKPRDFSKGNFKAVDTVEKIYNTITNGLAGTAMVGYKHLPDNDRWALAYYVKSLKKKA